jgi:hypothetical protein
VDTLASLFRLDPERLQRRLIDSELGGHPWLRECGPVAIREVAAAMVQRLPEALATRLDALVVAAFRQQPDLVALAAAADPQAPSPIPLPPQRLQSRHRPGLQLQVGRELLLEVVFTVTLELALEGVTLHVREGRPQAVAIQRAHASGVLLLERQILARCSEAPLALPPLLELEGPAVRENRPQASPPIS